MQPIDTDSPRRLTDAEAIERFNCFGGECTVLVGGAGPGGTASEAAALARRLLLEWHDRFSRLLPDSELSQLNRDSREVVEVSPMMARLARSIGEAGALTGGLVDGTLVEPIEITGHRGDMAASPALELALALAPPRRPARASREARWSALAVDPFAGTLRRRPGVMLDGECLLKGMLADVLGELLEGHESFCVNAAGDLLIGGVGNLARPIEIQSPFDGSIIHVLEERRGGVATSGIAPGSWIDDRGAPAHRLLDPSTGRPAFTGIVQATALAPSALLAEARAEAAILAGPGAARSLLPHGGVLVFDDGSHEVVGRSTVATDGRERDVRPRLSGPVALAA